MVEQWLNRLRDELLASGKNVFPRLVIAFFILVAGIIAARIARRWLGNALDKTRVQSDLLLRNFFLRSLSVTILVLAAFSALGQLGWDIRAFLTGLGITGIIIGFGLRDTLSNFASGLLLLIYRPFRAGEVIELEGSQGTVQELTIVNMQMISTDGVRVIMPNSKVWGAKIINYSMSEKRRVELTVKIPDEKIDVAIEIITAKLKKDSRLLRDPAPSAEVTAISERAATLRILAWTRPDDFQSLGGELYQKLFNSLSEAGVVLQ